MTGPLREPRVGECRAHHATTRHTRIDDQVVDGDPAVAAIHVDPVEEHGSQAAELRRQGEVLKIIGRSRRAAIINMIEPEQRADSASIGTVANQSNRVRRDAIWIAVVPPLRRIKLTQ